jgi:hypothetical protein
MHSPAKPLASFATVLACAAVLGNATTLQKLGMDEMIREATGIERAKVLGSYAAPVGKNIYTYYQFEVLEALKGEAQRQIAIPGGASGGYRQVVPGAPELSKGQEYVLFYWTSRTGLTQLLGLSQGLFSERADVAGNPMLVRPASTETMLNKDGKPIQDKPESLRLNDLRARIRLTLAQGATR